MKQVLAIFCLMVVAAFTTGRQASAETAAVRVVVLGDSLVAGYDLPQTDAFPSQLESMLLDRGYQVEVINAGVSGDTSTGALSRLKWAVPDDADMVIVELGANDALRGVPPESTKGSLRTIITRLQARGIKVLLAGMRAPPNMGQEYEAEFNVIYDELARSWTFCSTRFSWMALPPILISTCPTVFIQTRKAWRRSSSASGRWSRP